MPDDNPMTQIEETDLPETKPTPEGDGETGETTPKEPAADPNAELRTAMTELTSIVRDQAKPKDKEAELTPEQKNELWAIYDPKKTKPDFMKKFFRLNPEATPEEVAEAEDLFKDMQHGIAKQAVVGATNMTKIELAKLREEFGPLVEYVTQARAKETRGRFFDKYEALADAKFEKVVQATARLLADKTFKDEDEYFKALAEGAADTIRAVLPDFDLGSKTKEKPAGSTPRLPRTSAGGQGGTGARPAVAKTAATGDLDSLD